MEERAEIAPEIETRFTNLAGGAALALSVATAMLHGIGYLSLRFRLQALGVEVGQGVIDERFLFEGARCLMQILTTVPLLVLLGSPLFVLGVLARRSTGKRTKLDRLALATWQASPRSLLVFGSLWAAVVVRFVMHPISRFQNLLLGSVPHEPRWLSAVLLDSSGMLVPLHFAGLLVLLAPTAFCLLRLLRTGGRGSCTLVGLLFFVQALLIPVHFGILGAAAPVPRIAELPNEPNTSRIWRVFATADTSVFLVERPTEKGFERRLVSLPQERLERLDFLAREPLLEILTRAEVPARASRDSAP